MSKKSSGIARNLWSAGLALALAAPAASFGQNFPSSGLYFTSPMRLSGGYEHRSQGDRGSSRSPFGLLEQSISYIRLAPRTEFSATYIPEIELYAENNRFNAWNHSGSVRLAHRLTPRMKLEFGDAFVSTSDPSRRYSGSVFLLPRSRYNENSAYASVDFAYSPKTAMTFRFDNTIATYSLPDDTVGGLFDQMGNSWTAGVAHRLTPQSKVSGTYSFLKTRSLGRSTAGGPAYHHFSGGYKINLRQDLLLDFTGGFIQGGGRSLLFSGHIEKRVGDVWLGAGYSRHVSFYGGPRPVGGVAILDAPFANALLPSALYETVSARMRGRITPRLGMELETYLARSTRRERNSRSLAGRLRLDYRLTDHLGAFVSAEHYHQNLNEFLRVPVARRRYSAGVEIILSPAPNPIVMYRERTRIGEAETGLANTPASVEKPSKTNIKRNGK